jgi:phenylacetate-CoA ligase
MADWKYQLYLHLPPALRNVAATIRGRQLRYWRYGPETEQLAAEALERDRWSAAQWTTFQENRLGYLLHRAATQVPYYRDLWAARRRQGDQSSWDNLENWPILAKETLRAQPTAFVADDRDPHQMLHVSTSGTTGKPLDLWRSRATSRAWYAMVEARMRHWNGVTRRQNWSVIGGQTVVPVTQSSPPFWVWNGALDQLYLAANRISADSAPHYIRALRDRTITHMIAYTSSVTYLAQMKLKFDLPPLDDLRLILTNAEPLYPWQRDLLVQAFRCEVRETYGMAEIVAAASEDAQGQLRIWPDVGYLEVFADESDSRLPPGQAGRLICTGLINDDLPLIRYQVGDRGSLSTQTPDPADDIQLPIMPPIEGRDNDMLVGRDGSRVFWINPVFYEMPIVEAQVVQDSLDKVLVRYVPAQAFTDATKATITQRFRDRMGDIQVDFEQVSQVPRMPNGKFRAVVCHLSDEEQQRPI